jgi:hypothetical protein
MATKNCSRGTKAFSPVFGKSCAEQGAGMHKEDIGASTAAVACAAVDLTKSRTGQTENVRLSAWVFVRAKKGRELRGERKNDKKGGKKVETEEGAG